MPDCCKTCKYFAYAGQCDDRGICNHPERDDTVCHYYYGYHKDTDSCAKFESKEANSNAET